MDNIATGPGFGCHKHKLCIYHMMGDGLDGDTMLLLKMDFLTTDTLLYLTVALVFVFIANFNSF